MSRVYAGDARLMAELATERRIFVPYSAIPDMVKQAFVSAEDQNFWTHRGVDPLAIVRAGVFDLTHMGQGRRPIGASTITQQVAKNMLLDNQVSLARKAREAILAMRIEQTLTKERILELYLNEIYLGMGSYGVAAAAQAYFNKPLDKLTLSGGGVPGRLAEGAEQLQPVPVRRCGEGAARLGARPDGGGPRDHRGAGRRGQGGADRAGRVPSAAADSRRRLVRRGGAARADRPVRRRRHDAGRPDGAHQPRSRAAGRRREGGARRADGLRPQAGRLARTGDASRWRRGAGEELGRTAGAGGAAAGHAARLAARRGDGRDRYRGAGGLARPGRPGAASRRSSTPARCRCPISPGRGRCKDGKPRRAAAADRRRDAAGRRGDGRAGCRRGGASAGAGSEGRRPEQPAAKPAPAAAQRLALRQIPRCRARWCRSIRPPAGCSRWSAAGASRAASSTARPRRSASPVPASSRSSI